MNTVIERTGFDPAQDADNGNRFLTGNGYMGVRGTIGEAGVPPSTSRASTTKKGKAGKSR